METAEEVSAEDEEDSTMKKPAIGMIWVLVILSFFLYALAGMVAISLSLTIVAMVNSTTSISSLNNESVGDVCRIANDSETEDTVNNGEFYWTSTQQGWVLAAYFWGFFFGRFVGGRLAEVIGQRITAAIAIGTGGVIVALSPTAASWNVYCFVAARFLLGMFHGPTLSAIHSLMSKWAPRKQLATMLTTVNSGSMIGSTFGMLSSGWIIENFGWRWVFWSESIITFIWVPFWLYFVRNDPKDHPFLTPYEAKILEGNRTVTIKKTVPWKKILKSPYIYVCIHGLFVRVWNYVIEFTIGPTYFNKKIGLELSTTSLVTGIGSLVCLPSMLFYGRISDFLIKNNYVRKLTGRRIMHGIGTCGPAATFILMNIAGCSIPWTIALYQLTGIFASGTSSSIYVSVIDFAPNYAGTVMGILGLGNIGGSLAAITASHLAPMDNGWNKIFYLNAGLSLSSFITYTLFMTDEPQSWNFDEEDDVVQMVDDDRPPIETTEKF